MPTSLEDIPRPRTRPPVLALIFCGLVSVLMATSQAGTVGLAAAGVVILAILGQVLLGALLLSRPVVAILAAHALMVVVSLALQNAFIGQVLTYLPLAYNLGRRNRGQVTWTSVLIVISTSMALYLTLPHPTGLDANPLEIALTAGGTGMLLVALPALVGQGTRWQSERLSIVLRLAEAERQEARAATASALQAERARMARELHDVAAHHMTAVMINAKAARKRASGAEPEVLAFLDEIAGEATRATRSLQQVVGILREEEDDADRAPTPTLGDLPELVGRAAKINDKIQLRMDENVQDVAPAVGLATYRIVQESITNAHRHAPGAALRVELTKGNDALHVLVDSDAPTGQNGFTSGSGRGVPGMQSRARGLGGTLRAGPLKRGWRVQAELPYGGDTSSGEA